MGACFSHGESTALAVQPLPCAVADTEHAEYLGDMTIVYADYGGQTRVSRNQAFLDIRATSPTVTMYLPVLDNGRRIAFLVPATAP